MSCGRDFSIEGKKKKTIFKYLDTKVRDLLNYIFLSYQDIPLWFTMNDSSLTREVFKENIRNIVFHININN